ncbi:hypothetical protein [Neobacillus vireti]|uniref:hypothetical protein n=1 Tax=Neobacillus vireti TaxID=220686 RepID=UPI002FFF34CC
MGYSEGDWVREIDTGRIGICKKKSWCEVSVRFGKAAALRYPEELELAPLDIQNEDLLAMQHLAVEIGDEQWFRELAQKMGVEQLG